MNDLPTGYMGRLPIGSVWLLSRSSGFWCRQTHFASPEASAGTCGVFFTGTGED